MHDNLYNLVCDEIEELDKKAKNGKLSMQEMSYLDTLTHIKKSMLTSDAMEEAGYSNNYPYDGHNYSDGSSRGGSYRDRGASYARGRYAKRDSMGRYSRDDGMIEELHMMAKNPEYEPFKRDIERLIEKMEQV